MLLYLAEYLSQFHSGFNVFQYLTLRAILGVLTALLISFLVGPEMIRRLGRYQIGQPVCFLDDDPRVLLEVLVVQLPFQELSGAADSAKRILHLVGEPSDQLAGGLL